MTVEDKKMKSELFTAERTLLADEELVSSLEGSWFNQASEWVEYQRLRVEELVVLEVVTNTTTLLADDKLVSSLEGS